VYPEPDRVGSCRICIILPYPEPDWDRHALDPIRIGTGINSKHMSFSIFHEKLPKILKIIQIFFSWEKKNVVNRKKMFPYFPTCVNLGKYLQVDEHRFDAYLDPDLDRHQNVNSDPDPDRHQNDDDPKQWV
jgi:hypothetical protein